MKFLLIRKNYYPYKLENFISLLFCSILLIALNINSANAFIADHTAAGVFGKIPSNYFSTIRDRQKIYYGHTSHGSQLITGMEMLEDQDDNRNPGLYDRPEIHEDSPDLGYPEWETNTRNYLKDHPETTLVMWSWCGQLSDISSDEVDQYLSKMDKLETDYPDVTFVYMTGHLDGSGANGTLNKNNERIRAYCKDHSKTLYDFADIETYDPGGKPYPNGSDACEWCENWCETYSCPECEECAHSHCFNCYLKGRALWWMLARIEGWSGQGGNTGFHDFYVQQSVGSDLNAGDAWGAGHALRSIGRAIQLASNTDGADTIHVAAGNYRETVEPVSQITFYGGYPGNGGSIRNNMSGTVINGENIRQGIRIEDCEKVVIDGFVIRNGKADPHGGGVYINGSSDITVSNSAVENNQATADGDGGGIAVIASSATLSKNNIIDNTCSGLGGGIFINQCDQVTVTENTISNNHSDDGGGGIACVSSSAEISRNTITNNMSSDWGGGLFLESSGRVDNNVIVNNSADVGGGVSYGKDPALPSALLINNTISGNSISTLFGAGVYCHGNPGGVVVNCIVWGNTPGQIDKAVGSEIAVTFSDVQGGYSGVGNINSAPGFSGIGNYELAKESPCIDAGTSTLAPDIDIDGNTRPQGDGVDMGAYEYTAAAPAVASTSPESGAAEVDPGTAITVTFSVNMDASTINSQTFTLKNEAGDTVSGTIAYSNKTASFTPAGSLAAEEKYAATLTTGIKNAKGEPLSEDYSWDFTTADETGGGGGGCFVWSLRVQ
jgi:parallel beta-helix repeat protein